MVLGNACPVAFESYSSPAKVYAGGSRHVAAVACLLQLGSSVAIFSRFSKLIRVASLGGGI